jgi:eukaryotic-like serine/threonine-protein kinase
LQPDRQQKKSFEISLADLSGDELLRRWKAGDEQAAEILFDRYSLRLVALVASRMNRRFRDAVDPDDIVQSAMGSFFDAARHSRIQVSGSVSLWRLLATFARRKMARSIEKQTAAKRGGDQVRVSLEAAEQEMKSIVNVAQEATISDFLVLLETELTINERELLEHLLTGKTQREIAGALGVDERTVRRRVTRLRDVLAPVSRSVSTTPHGTFSSATLPRIDYREFVLGRLVGAGGFGKVYRAAMQTDGSLIAVKFLRKSFWQNNEAKQSFLREIDQASQINHSGVVRYLGWGQSPHGGPYVVANWIDSVTLIQRRSVSPETFIGYLKQICDALDAVHKAGIVHGDLTPSNILFTASNQIAITHRTVGDRAVLFQFESAISFILVSFNRPQGLCIGVPGGQCWSSISVT